MRIPYFGGLLATNVMFRKRLLGYALHCRHVPESNHHDDVLHAPLEVGAGEPPQRKSR
jgi:hypothetical protein